MVRLATPADIDQIVDLHLKVLHWSVNGQLGRDHIDALYRALFRGDDFFAVVMDNPMSGELLGFATASTDAAAARRRIRGSITWPARLKLLVNALRRPSELVDLIESAIVVPILVAPRRISAEVLTWVTQPRSPGGAIAGTRCFNGVLDELAARGHPVCMAQVLRTNNPPNRFHELRGTEKAFALLSNNIYIIECSHQARAG